MNPVHERAIELHSGEAAMAGILTLPSPPHPPRIGIVIVNGGAQYRVGAHRLFVKLSRQLAARGHAVLRFDLPGQGESSGQALGFEQVTPHIGAAIEALRQQVPGLREIALLGLCDGASASLLYLHETGDPRVGGLILLNPWVRTESTSAKTAVKHYYRHRLFMPEFWQKLMAGRVGFRAMRDLLGTVSRSRTEHARYAGTFQDRMAAAWHGFSGAILLLISEKDLTGQEFIQSAMEAPAWQGALQHPGLAHYVLQQADHTFSTVAATRDLFALVELWVDKTLINKT